MTKKLMTILAVPLACLGLGYSAGIYILSSSSAEAAPAPQDHQAANHGNPQGSDASDGHATDGSGHADAGHSPRPASSTETRVPGNVLRLGRMTVPVYRASSVTYVVADMGLSLETTARADDLRKDENFARVRSAVLAAMTDATQDTVLSGAETDTEALSGFVLEKLKSSFVSVEEVIFLDFYRQDVARS